MKLIFAKHKNLMILLFSILYNVLAFVIVYANYNPVYATNDDYRMALIASGGYTGEPSGFLVFMKYPVGFILSFLYKTVSAVPWYAVFTLMCVFIPSCIFCFFLIHECRKNKRPFAGIVLYTLLFIFIIQKHVMIPQFTLTTAFLAVSAVVILYYSGDKHNPIMIFAAIVLSVLAFSIREKVFYMVMPVILLIIVLKVINNKKNIRKLSVYLLATALCCAVVTVADKAATSFEEYKEYKEFNTARSLIYDFKSRPGYNENQIFLNDANIDETIYRAISARYLDIDPGLNTQMYREIIDYTNEIAEKTPFVKRLANAFSDSFGYFADSSVIYPTIFTLFMFSFCFVIVVWQRRRDVLPLLIGTAGGMCLEMTYLCYISRVMPRLTEVFLLTLNIVVFIVLASVLPERKERRRIPKTPRHFVVDSLFIYRAIALTAAAVFVISFTISNQKFNASISETQNKINARMTVLNNYAHENPEIFIFYDSLDFIAGSSNIFAIFDKVVNTESLGNWYINSPNYFIRNEMYGFTSSIDGLINGENIYYAAIGGLKLGITRTLKDRYNKELMQVDSLATPFYTIKLYIVIDCD